MWRGSWRHHEISLGDGASSGTVLLSEMDQLALATLAWRLSSPIPAPVQRVLLRAMNPDPSQRFGSVAVLVEALEEASVSTAAGELVTKAGASRTLAGGSFPGLAETFSRLQSSGLRRAVWLRRAPSAGRAEAGACARAVLADATVLRRRRAAGDGAPGRPDERRGVRVISRSRRK